MINDAAAIEIPGVAGVVSGGIMPGLVGYESGQASLGDSFAWVARMTAQSLADLDAVSPEDSVLGHLFFFPHFWDRFAHILAAPHCLAQAMHVM